MFNRLGLRDATLSLIAAEIGLNLKSLRYYFKRREDLIAAAFLRSIEVHQHLARQALAEDGVRARLYRFVNDYFELCAAVRLGKRPEFVYFGDARALTAPHSELVGAAYFEMFESIRELVRTPEIEWDPVLLNASAHMLLS